MRLRRCEDALAWLRKQHAEESLPLLRLPAKTDDLDAIAEGRRTGCAQARPTWWCSAPAARASAGKR